MLQHKESEFSNNIIIKFGQIGPEIIAPKNQILSIIYKF